MGSAGSYGDAAEQVQPLGDSREMANIGYLVFHLGRGRNYGEYHEDTLSQTVAGFCSRTFQTSSEGQSKQLPTRIVT